MLQQLKLLISNKFEMPEAELFAGGCTFAHVLEKSSHLNNSVDLLEAFAGAIAEVGLDDRLDLPVFTLNHTVADVMAEIEIQLTQVERAQ